MAPSNLQIPDSNPGPSRYPQSAGASHHTRPTSVAAHTATNQHSASRRQRASHTVVSPASQPQQNEDPVTDVYSHPAAVAYAAAHPRRTIPKFGPYLLLQTLGEGEFGKVKLGLHCQWGEEVAVKLIRRGNVDSSVRMTKVEREIEVLKMLKHPNIVRLYDVIETDKYIGIILEYASGGELFDHILAHRYLRERDAAKLFSQLISGVWYIHQKKIVHRDLKLENLLLDRHRNVIITDFGFANRFEHRSDDLMQTSCGSPCYAAPELVISEGLYVGSAVDIWSCGVILYAMLAGYLPFDDDPANPDGDNINLLYKYIVSTPLSFPDYISTEARDLLSMMLVPDPTRRTSLEGVMRHPWLGAYQSTRTDGIPNSFGRTVDELETAAMEQHHSKRQAYQRQLRATAVANGTSPSNTSTAVASPSRTQSHRPEHNAPPSSSRSRSTQPEYLYDSSADQTMASPTATPRNGTAAAAKTYGSPAALGLAEDDPFAGPGGSTSNNAPLSSSTSSKPPPPRASEDAPRSAALSPAQPPSAKSHKRNSSGGGSGGGGEKFRHTIQVEYGDPNKDARRSEDKKRERSGSQPQGLPLPPSQQPNGISALPPISPPQPPAKEKERRPSQSGAKPLPPSPPAAVVTAAPSSYRTPTKSRPPAELNGLFHPPPPSSAAAATAAFQAPPTPTLGNAAHDALVVNVSSPPATPNPASAYTPDDKDKDSQNSASSAKNGHKRGKSSVDRIGLGKIFGGGFGGSNSASGSVNTNGDGGAPTPTPSDGRGASTTSVLLSPVGAEKEKEGGGKKSRRNTLTVMVEPISRSIRNRKGKMTGTPMTADGGSAANGGKQQQQQQPLPQPPHSAVPPSMMTATTTTTTAGPDSGFPSSHDTSADGAGMQASTNKAKKVMQWFRSKSKGRDSVGYGVDDQGEKEGYNYSTTGTGTGTPTQNKYRKGYSASSSTINQTTGPPSAFGLAESARVSPQVVVTTPTSAAPRPVVATPVHAPGHPHRSASTATEASVATPSFVARFRNSVNVGSGGGGGHRDRDHRDRDHHSSSSSSHPYGQLRIHHGAVDQTTITTRPPPEVMAHVRKVLEGMGVEIQLESEYKYRCIRMKKRKATVPAGGSPTQQQPGGGGLAAVTMVGSAASGGVDKRGLPLPSPSAFSNTSVMLRGLLMRRQSSQVSTHSHHSHQGYGHGQAASSASQLAFDDETSVVVSEPLVMSDSGSVGGAGASVYGDPTQDAGDEVRFSVELTRLDRLNDTFSLDIRRLKGNLRSYKFLYDTLRERADLSAIQA